MSNSPEALNVNSLVTPNPLSCSILAEALSLEVIEYEAFAEPVIDNSPAFAEPKKKKLLELLIKLLMYFSLFSFCYVKINFSKN